MTQRINLNIKGRLMARDYFNKHFLPDKCKKEYKVVTENGKSVVYQKVKEFDEESEAWDWVKAN